MCHVIGNSSFTKAKTAVIQSRNICSSDGNLATDTSSDMITIATIGKGKPQNYAGSVTVLGWLIARAVQQALSESLDAE